MSTTMALEIIAGRFRLGDEITREDSVIPGRDGHENRSRVNLKNDKARVYRAEDLETGQTVAVKILNRGTSKVAEFRSRFQRDASIMRSIEHPNIVKTIASGLTAEGQPYLAMELLEGKTLAAKLAEQKTIPPDEMAQYLQQVAAALDAAHAAGIVHRDINPDAIMILEQADGSNSVKLLDFGLAKEISRSAVSEAELTGKQTILGRAAYLSPEQARGSEIDNRSDVYSLGVTLYQALTGRLPFEGDTDFQILLAQINGTVPPFPKRWSNHPGASAIEAVVLKALSKKPADRPASAGILANLFSQALLAKSRRGITRFWPVLAGASVLTLFVLLAKWFF